jgi:deoxyribose-phosphate aldolase
MTASVAAQLAAMFDHTCLRPDARARDVAQLCEEGVRLGCATVCVNPRWVEHADALLTGSGVVVCTVAGFPLGATTALAKATEAERSVRDGASEIDMVIDLGGLLDGRHASVRADIEAVRTAVGGVTLKVILESAMLDAGQIRTACGLAVDAGADFVKTSTGFGPGGATEEAVRLMRQCVGSDKGVKASGGIKDLATARRMIAAGADRLGTSATVSILESVGERA